MFSKAQATKANGVAVATQFQSEVDAFCHETDTTLVRSTVHISLIMILAIVLFLAVTKVDRVVTSNSGKIVSTVAPSLYQALDVAIVKTIDVHAGDQVAKGQTLATLDPTFAGADVAQLSQEVASLEAQIARAEAEKAGRAPVFSDSSNPGRRRYADIQMDFFKQRAAQYQAQVNSFEQRIATQQATIKKLLNDESRTKERAVISEKVENMRSALLAKGAGSLLNELTSREAHIEAVRNVESLQNQLVESRHQLSSLQADQDAFKQGWLADISKEIVTARSALQTAAASLEKAEKHKELVRLVAKDDSIVLNVAKLTTGAIIKEGDMVVTTVPLSAPMEAEIHISNHDIGFLRAGDPAVVKVDAFNFAHHGVAHGVVKWISEGAFNTDDQGVAVAEPYYLARVAITKMDFIDVPENFRLIPGMTLVSDMKVGRRTLASYVMEGLLSHAGRAMREP